MAIEAAMLAREGRVYAIGVDPEGVAICLENIHQHKVDNVKVIAGRAPEALSVLETPDAVFVGGSKGSMEETLEVVINRLAPGGRVVANAITLENANEIYTTMRRRGLAPEVTLVQFPAPNRWHAICVTKRPIQSRFSPRPNQSRAASYELRNPFTEWVGPGATGLLTHRAVKILRRAPVIILPRSSHYGVSTAWKIIRPIVHKVPYQEHLFITFPMSRQPAKHAAAWEKAFAQIGPRLERGLSVAFATEGDPSLYSSFVYLQREASQRWPMFRSR